MRISKRLVIGWMMVYILTSCKSYLEVMAGMDPAHFDPDYKLEIALSEYSVNGVREAIREGADINRYITRRYMDKNIRIVHPGYTPFQVLISSSEKFGEPEGYNLINELIKNGADVTTADGIPLIMLTRDTKIATLLIESGVDVNASTPQGKTALMEACGAISNYEMVKLLLKYGANIHAKENKFGRTALLIASGYFSKDHIKIVEILLDNGANFMEKDRGGRTAIDWAETTGDPEMIKTLRKRISK